MSAKIPSPSYNIKKSKPKIHSTLKVTKSASVTKETAVNKDTTNLQAKKEIVSEKETESKEKEVPEEKPAQVAEVKETLKEEIPAEERKEEVAKKEDVETVQVAKVTEESETVEKAEPTKEEIPQEAVALTSEDMETKEPAKIEEPSKEIPVEEKPEADVPATKKSTIAEKTLSQERISSPEVDKPTGFQETEKVSEEKGKFEGEKKISLRSGTDNKRIPSTKDLKEGTINSKGKGEPESQGSTPEQTAPFSQEGYAHGQDTGNQQSITQAKQEGEGKTIVEEKSHGMGIPVSEVLVPVDLKIEVFLRKPSSIQPEPQAQKIPVPSKTPKQKNLPKATEITKVTLEESDTAVIVQIKGNGAMTPKVFSLDNNRIVMDFPKTAMKAQLPSKGVPLLKEIRSGKHKDKSRIVLELHEKLPFDFVSSGNTVVVTVLKSENKPSPPPVEQKVPEITEAKELKETDISNISMRLLRNAHPMANRREKQTEVSLLEGKRGAHSGNVSGVRKTFSVLRTVEGAYTFAVKNQENDAYEADLAFFIFPGKKGERTKKYAAIALSPHTTVKFRFVLPEGIFWDDEEYFSGKIENSETMTKFNQKTGFVWKEIKDE